MKKRVTLTESQLISLISRIIVEAEEEKPKVKKEENIKRTKDFILFAQAETNYPTKLDPSDKSVLLVKKPQSDEIIMKLDLGYNIEDCNVDFIKHDGMKATLICSPKF